MDLRSTLCTPTHCWSSVSTSFRYKEYFLCTSAYLCMFNAQTSSSSQKYLLYFFSSLVLYINHLALKRTLVSSFDLCMHFAHHLIYVLYRTETAGYIIPSLIYVLYRTETAGYMVPSLIYVYCIELRLLGIWNHL